MDAPSSVTLRFHDELNDHLAPAWRDRSVAKPLLVPGSVKDIIQSCGVPHSEVGRIVVDGTPVDFAYIVHHGDRIDVYPGVRRGPALFVLDVHLGKLAAYMRMLGFDTVYRSCFRDEDLARVSAEQNRILLTRDRGLLKRSAVTRGHWLRETDSRRQVAEIVRRFDLGASLQPFSRCMACNGVLCAATKEEVREYLPPRVAATFTDFRRCTDCRRVYWQGTHYERMRRWIGQMTAS